MFLNQNFINFRGKPLFQRARLKTPYRDSVELHDLACFFYIVEGTYEATEAHGGYKIGSKEALIKKCGNYVSHYLKTEEHQECEAVAIYLYPELFQEIYKNQLPSFLKETEQHIRPPKMVANELIDKFINNLFIYFENPSLIDEELALLKLKELVLILLKSEQYENVQKFLFDLFSPHKIAFTSVIENNIFSNISIEELAFICNKSLSSFKREFKKVYDETPARYIKNRRLEHAANLLLSSEDTISGIAYESGFQDVTTFSHSFHMKYKISPSQYRLNQIRK